MNVSDLLQIPGASGISPQQKQGLTCSCNCKVTLKFPIWGSFRQKTFSLLLFWEEIWAQNRPKIRYAGGILSLYVTDEFAKGQK